jgi:prolyl oligopeptidase
MHLSTLALLLTASLAALSVPDDPYLSLEDVGSEPTRSFIQAQDERTRRFVEALPGHALLHRRLREVTDQDVYGVPVRRGGRTFFLRQERSRATMALHVEDAAGGERLLVDPEAVGPEPLVLSGFVPSPDGRRVAYGLSRPGSNWAQWRVRDVDSNRDLPDLLTGLRGPVPVAWAADGGSLFYAAAEEPAAGTELSAVLPGQRVFHHRLGTSAGAAGTDPRIAESPGPGPWTFAPAVTEDGRYLVLTLRQGSDVKNRVLVKELDRPHAPDTPDTPVVPLLPEDASWAFVGGDGPVLWFRTDRGAPRGRVVAVDLRQPRRPQPGSWKELIPESEDTLSMVSVVAGRFVAFYVQSGLPRVRVFGLDGRLERQVTLPQLGTTFSGFIGLRSDPEAFVNVNSVAMPGTPYRFDPATGAFAPFRKLQLRFDPESFVMEQVFYPGKDGTRIPMFLAYRRGLDPKAGHPALVYGYGAFGWSAFPWFQPHVLVFLEQGGIYALPGIRGGGENGEAWHQAGAKRNKQTSIDDFLAALEWLVARGYTSRDRLAVQGGSASGLLAGAAMVQRPDLFRAALVDIPVVDMLRFDRFTAGARWVPEFGSPSDPEDLRALRAYSPYHNLEAGTCYPSALIVAGERDETATPAHAYKLTAALQAAQGCGRPVLLKVAWGAGHALGATPEAMRETEAAQLAFLLRELGMTPRG